MTLERTGAGRWYLKGTNVSGDTDVWLKVIEGAFDEDDTFSLPGA